MTPQPTARAAHTGPGCPMPSGTSVREDPHDQRSDAAAARFSTGVSLFGNTLPTAAEVGIVCAFAVVFITLSVAGFGKPE